MPTLEKNNQKIYYTLKVSKRAKRIRLAMYSDGSLVVTKPYGLPGFFINSFLHNKTNWILSKLAHFHKNASVNIVQKNKAHYLKHRGQARHFIEQTVREINEFYKFDYKRISIRNQTTRWGSCSQHGNLNFNYKLLFMPKEAATYVITHELCHLKEMNHSPRFWALVARTIPNFKAVRTGLKKRGLNL